MGLNPQFERNMRAKCCCVLKPRASLWRRAPALLALAGVQLTAFAGAAGVMLAAEHIEHFTAIILSIAAGTFLYIGATDLLPQAGESGKFIMRPSRTPHL